MAQNQTQMKMLETQMAQIADVLKGQSFQPTLPGQGLEPSMKVNAITTRSSKTITGDDVESYRESERPIEERVEK